MDPKQKIDVVISVDIAQIQTIEEFVNVFAEALVSAQPISFEALNEQFNLTDRKFYIRLKNMPETRPGSDIIEKRAELLIGC